MSYKLAHVVHVLAAVIWIGALLVIYFNDRVVQTNTGNGREQERMAAILNQLYPWVWSGILAAWVTGIWMMFFVFDGFGAAGAHVDTMFLLALIMTVMFAAEYFISRPRLMAALGKDPDTVGQRLRAIIRHSKIALLLGLLTVAVASYGTF